jgi:hypothetical protein
MCECMLGACVGGDTTCMWKTGIWVSTGAFGMCSRGFVEKFRLTVGFRQDAYYLDCRVCRNRYTVSCGYLCENRF